MNKGSDRTMNGGVSENGDVIKGEFGGAGRIGRNAPRLALAVCVLLSAFPSPAGAAEPAARAFDFSRLAGIVFTFASGAGAWRTNVAIRPDGTFTGQYSDADMGETGPGYPCGTVYVCNFSGAFLPPAKTPGADYACTLKCRQLSQEGTPDEEKIICGVRYVNAVPYGFENAAGGKGFTLFVPGASSGELPEAIFLGTGTERGDGDGAAPPLDRYVLYFPEDEVIFQGEAGDDSDVRSYDIDWK